MTYRNLLEQTSWHRLAVLGIVVSILGCSEQPSFERDRPMLDYPSSLSQAAELTFPAANSSRIHLTAVRAFPELSFNGPVLLIESPVDDNRLFVAEREGTIRSFENSDQTTEAKIFLDLREKVWSLGGSGLLGMAFSPSFEEDGTFYVHYTTREPRQIFVSSFKVRPGSLDEADPDSEQVLIRLDKTHQSHNGGMIAFGPDGMLYVAIGDAMKDPFERKNAQDLTSLLGKILRIDPASGSPYRIPPDNPFVDAGGGIRPEIWAYGFRQPWRFSFDEDTGDLWVGEVGGEETEEINLVEKGGNYGWAEFEGYDRHRTAQIDFEETKPPVMAIPHAVARAVIGGFVYRGDLLPSIRGAYVYGDFKSGKIWALRYENGEVISNEGVSLVKRLSSFALHSDGQLYALSMKGRIYRFVDGSRKTTGVRFPERLSQTGIFKDTASFELADGLLPYDVVSPLWSDGAIKKRWIALPQGRRIQFQPSGEWQFPVGTVLVMHLEMRTDPRSPPRRLETRALVHERSGWAAYTYKWNDAQTDAVLSRNSESERLNIEDEGGNQREQEYQYLGSLDCMRCHGSAAGFVLGLRTDQINFDVDRNGQKVNQLLVWEDLGMFEEKIGDPARLAAMVDPADSAAPIEKRARSYLAANCSNCHRKRGPVRGMDLRYEVATADTHTVLARPAGNDREIGGDRIEHLIKPGQKEMSYLWRRISSRHIKERMPPMGSSRVDPLAKWLIGSWIDDHLREP